MTRRAILLVALLMALIILFSLPMLSYHGNAPSQEILGPTAIIWLPEIVITTIDLPAGIVIPATALTTCVWPVSMIPQRAYTLPLHLLQPRTTLDIAYRTPIFFHP